MKLILRTAQLEDRPDLMYLLLSTGALLLIISPINLNKMIEKLIEELKSQLRKRINNLNNDNWRNCQIVFSFSPSEDKSSKGSFLFEDASGNKMPIGFGFDEELSGKLYSVIAQKNKTVHFNQMIFKANYLNMEDCKIEFQYDPKIDEEFNAALPKSKKGKIRAWYLSSEDETLVNRSEISTRRAQFDMLYSKLPGKEPALQGLSSLRIDELYNLVRTYASDAGNPLWDGSVFTLKKNISGNYEAQLLAHYAEKEEDRVNGYAIAEQRVLTNVTDRMITIYEALQAKTKELKPAVEWDTVFISIYRDGFIEANYERNGEEVELASINDSDVRRH